MDKIIARKIADNKLQNLLLVGSSKVYKLLDESEYDFVTEEGVEYQIKSYAFYDDKKNNVIRVCVDVDDQKFISSLLPLTHSELIKLD